MRRPLNSFIRISSTHGQITNLGHFGRHLGVDYSVAVNNTVYAPVSGRITKALKSSALGNYYEIVENGNNRIHRLAHLNKLNFGVGTSVSEGQAIGLSGNTGITTGPHVHWDVRAANTLWNSSFANYYNPEALVAQTVAKMPPIWTAIRIKKGQVRTTYYPGSTAKAGTIRATDDTFVYTVRGYDPKYPYRIIINSKSGGGDNIALALYYTNGNLIEGWERV